MNNHALVIRQPTIADGDAIAVLTAQLGYPSSGAEILERLTRLHEHENATILVAVIDERVVGVITAHTFPTIHATQPAAWITMLVVDESTRGQRVGRTLVTAVEEWATARGTSKMSVTSATHRDDAHGFYEGIGYARSGVRFAKLLKRGSIVAPRASPSANTGHTEHE